MPVTITMTADATEVATALGRLQQAVDQRMSAIESRLASGAQATQQFSERSAKHLQALEKSFDGLSRTVTRIQGILATIGVSLGLGAIAKQAIDTAASFEQLDTQLKFVVGSMQEFQDARRFILQFTATTPLQLGEVTKAFIDLTRRGFEVQRTMKAVADVASLQLDPSQAFQHIIFQLGQIADRAKLTGDNLKDLSTSGVSIGRVVEELRKMGIAIKGDIGDASVSAAKGIEAITRVLEQDFRDATLATAGNWKTLVSNLRDTWGTFQDFVVRGPILDFLKGLVSVIGNELTRAVKEDQAAFEAWGAAAVTWMQTVILNVAGLVDALSLIAAPIIAAGRALYNFAQQFDVFTNDLLSRALGGVAGALETLFAPEATVQAMRNAADAVKGKGTGDIFLKSLLPTEGEVRTGTQAILGKIGEETARLQTKQNEIIAARQAENAKQQRKLSDQVLGDEGTQRTVDAAAKRAKAEEDILAASLKRQEALTEASFDERRRMLDAQVSLQLKADPGNVRAIAAQRSAELKTIAVEEARDLEAIRLASLDRQLAAQLHTLDLEKVAHAGKAADIAKIEELQTKARADADAKREEILKKTGEVELGISKHTVDEQIKQAEAGIKRVEQIEERRLQARIDVSDAQIALVQAQVDGEVLTYDQGATKIRDIQMRRLDDTAVLYQKQAQFARNAITQEVADTEEGKAQIAEINDRLASRLKDLDLKRQTETQQFLNKQQEAYESFVHTVSDSLADIFEGLISGTLSVLESFKRIFLRTIAQIAAEVATRAIVVPILTPILAGAGGGTGGLLDRLFKIIGLGSAVTGLGGGGSSGGAETSGGVLSGLGLAKQLFSFLGLDSLTSAIGTGLSSLKETFLAGIDSLFQTSMSAATQAAADAAELAATGTTGFGGAAAQGAAEASALGGTTLSIAGGLALIGAGIYGALNASNNAAKAAYAASSAAGAAAAGIAAYAAIADVAVPTLAGLSATGIGLIAAAVLAVMAVVLDRVIKPAGPNLAVGQPAGLGVGVEGGKLVMTGQATSNVIRQEGVTAAQTGAVQTALNEGITRAVGTIIQTINAVALDPAKLVGPTQDALTRALADIQTINSASAKHMEQDIAEQLKFANIAIIGGMLDPINLAFEQLTDSDLKTQLERLPVTTIGLVDLFKTMNSQLDEMAKGENRDVLGQIQGVREQLDRFGARLARTAGDTAEQIVNGVIQQFDDAIERTQPLKLVSDFSHNLSTLITTFNERMTDGLTALVTLQKTQKTLEDAGLSGAEVGSQVDRLTADLAQQGEIFSTRIVSDALKNLATELDQVVIQPIRIQATTVDSLFTDSLAALNSLWLEWHRLADVGIDTTRMQAQFQKILEGVLSSSADLLRNTLQRGTFPEFLDVLLSIPDALAKLNPVFERLKALGQAFASVVGPIQQAISQGEESLRTPTERVDRTAQQMRELEAAIADAGTSAEKALPLYAQLAAVIQANAAAQIAAVQQVGAVIEQITTMLDARLTTSQRLARVNQQLIDLQAGRRPGEGVSNLAPWLPTAAGAPTPGRESIDVLSELVTLYGQQMDLMGQLVDAIHTGLDSISETLRADEPLIDRVMRLVAAATPRQDIAGIAREQTPEALLRQASALQEAIGAVRELIGVIAQGLAQIDETLRANETQTERAIRLVAAVPSATGVTDPAALIAIAGQIGDALTAVRAVMDLLQGGIESIDSTLFDLLSVADQAANVQAKMLALNEEIAASSGATPEQLIALTGLTQRALTLQQQLTRTLEATLEDLRASVEGTGRPSETIADTRSQIAALQQLVDTGAATPEQLQQLVDVNQQLLDLGKQFDLLDVQQEALDSLKALAPMIQAQIDASQAREQALVDNLEAIRGQLAGYLAVATSTEAQLIVQLTDIRAWLEGLLSQAKSTEAQLVAQLAGVQFILQAQLERLHNETLITEDLLRQQLNQLNQQLLAQYGTTNIQDIVRRIQEQALDELRTLNARLKDLFLAQPDAQALFGIQTTLDGQSGQMDRQTQHLSSLVDQTNTVINKLDDLYASLNRPLRTTPAQSGGWLYASLNRAATGPLGYARGGMVRAILEPGETVFPPPFTSSQTHALMAMNTSFPRMGGGWTVPGSGDGDHVSAMLPSGSFVLNRRASGAVGYQDGGSVQGSVSTNHVTINIQVYQQPGQSGRELVEQITKQLRREFRTKNDPGPFK